VLQLFLRITNDEGWAFQIGGRKRLLAGPFESYAVVGRHPRADAVLLGPPADEPYVSRMHLVLDFHHGHWWVKCVGRQGWDIASSSDVRLRRAPGDTPYPVVHGMQVRLIDNRRVMRRYRPILQLLLEDPLVDDASVTPDGDEHTARIVGRDLGSHLWPDDEPAHRLAILLRRLHPTIPSNDVLETALGVSHGTLHNYMDSLLRHLNMTYDRQTAGGRTKAAFVAEALAEDDLFQSLPPSD
jgi:pSer/pThr/pTyr-binding forkhead associated (FHA) protein